MTARVPRMLSKLRKVALALPEAHEVEAWGTATFRVKNKLYAMWAAGETHAGKGRNGVWVKAASADQKMMLAHDPKRFFFPPYVGKGGWIGVYLDENTRWDELEMILDTAWRMTAPKTLVKKHPPRED